jgi:2-polyprenyl-3-methyl-5-hydroxy-6-metoxy-1,4-benzoquinol methylase
MEYYERYWNGPVDKNGVAAAPPVWNKTDLARVLRFIAPYCRGRVLDFGCGQGVFTYELSQLSPVSEVFGVDLSRAAIERAKRTYPKIQFEALSSGTLPFEEGAFDMISVVEVMEHLLDPAQTLRDMVRVLKPGGHLMITTTDYNWLKQVIIAAFFWGKYFRPTNPHIRFFTKKTLKDLLYDVNLDVVAYEWNGRYGWIMPKGQMVVAKKRK